MFCSRNVYIFRFFIRTATWWHFYHFSNNLDCLVRRKIRILLKQTSKKLKQSDADFVKSYDTV